MQTEGKDLRIKEEELRLQPIHQGNRPKYTQEVTVAKVTGMMDDLGYFPQCDLFCPKEAK